MLKNRLGNGIMLVVSHNSFTIYNKDTLLSLIKEFGSSCHRNVGVGNTSKQSKMIHT